MMMDKLKKMIPTPQELKQHKYMRLFGDLLQDPHLWHVDQNTVAKAVAVGLFVAFMPVPLQMLLAAAIAIIVRANLPIAVALVWISNPVTMPPLFYGAYKLGAFIMGAGEESFHMELSLDWLLHGLGAIWQPFLLGCLVMGTVCAVIGYIATHIAWRMDLADRWKNKHHVI